MADPLEPMFSLPAGEGAGAILGLAAGDVAGGAQQLGYSALTQQLTVVAYHLMRHGEVVPEMLVAEMGELAGRSGGGRNVYREPSPELIAFLESGEASTEESAEPALRAIPLGIWYRHEPDALLESVLSLGRLSHTDAPSLVAAAALAAGVAASAFAQGGADLLLGAAEMSARALGRLGGITGLTHIEEAASIPARLRSAMPLVGAAPIDVSRSLAAEPDRPHGIELVALALVLAAPTTGEHFRLLEAAALLGGSLLGAMVGSMVGARVGIRVWPWIIPNDTWFAEIGRRLVVHAREYRDLPIPYDAEEYVTYGLEGRDLFEM